jgi:hypothetical protein
MLHFDRLPRYYPRSDRTTRVSVDLVRGVL